MALRSVDLEAWLKATIEEFIPRLRLRGLHKTSVFDSRLQAKSPTQSRDDRNLRRKKAAKLAEQDLSRKFFIYCIRIRQAVAIRQPLVVFLHMRKARAPRERREHRRRPQLRQNENKNRAFPKAKKTLRALAIARKSTRNHRDMQTILHKRKNAQRVPHPPQKYFFIFRFLPRSE